MPARSVVVVMPFGGKGKDETEKEVRRRRAILNFKRVEYLIRSKCKVTAAIMTGGTERVAYAVEVARTAMDDIPDRAPTDRSQPRLSCRVAPDAARPYRGRLRFRRCPVA